MRAAGPAWRWNWRGCSASSNLLPRGYHSGVSEDVFSVVRHLQAQRPLAPLYAVGLPAGRQRAAQVPGRVGRGLSYLQAAVAVSVPFRLDHCAERIDRGFSKVYQAHFMRALVAYVRDKQQRFTDEGHHERLAALQQLGPKDLGRLPESKLSI